MCVRCRDVETKFDRISGMDYGNKKTPLGVFSAFPDGLTATGAIPASTCKQGLKVRQIILNLKSRG